MQLGLQTVEMVKGTEQQHGFIFLCFLVVDTEISAVSSFCNLMCSMMVDRAFRW